jgi:hypothetical protein
MIRKFVLLAIALLLLVSGTACMTDTDADVASKNLSKAAEQFEIPRQIVFFNGITDKYLLTIQGLCSIESGPGTGVASSLEVTCKVGKDDKGNPLYKKHYLGLSDNVSYFVQQSEGENVSTTRYRIIFKPETVIPNFDRP